MVHGESVSVDFTGPLSYASSVGDVRVLGMQTHTALLLHKSLLSSCAEWLLSTEMIFFASSLNS